MLWHLSPLWDSSPGCALYEMVYEAKVVDADEINATIKAWFQIQFNKLLTDLTLVSQDELKRNLLEIYSYTSWDTQHKDLCNWIAQTFDQHYALLKACYGRISNTEADKNLSMLFHCVVRAEEPYRENFRNRFRKFLWENKMSFRYVFRPDEMFAAAYFNSETGQWHHKAHSFLTRFGKKTKCAIKDVPDRRNTPKKGLVNVLRILLFRFLLPKEGFGQASTTGDDDRVEAWLKENEILSENDADIL